MEPMINPMVVFSKEVGLQPMKIMLSAGEEWS